MSALEVLALPDCAVRLAMARDAATEIDALAELLQSAGPDVDDLAVRGVTMRIKALAGVVMGAVDDPCDPPDELLFRLTGTRYPEGGAL